MSGTDSNTSTGGRREALAALLAGSALGLATIGAPSTAAKGKGKKKRKNRGQNGNGNNNGSGNGGAGGNANVNLGNGNNVGGTLPSVRMVETTTLFDGDGVFDAISKCPDGYVPINGGFFSSVPNPVLLTSVPRLDENAWLIEIDGAQQGHQITVTAICLAATVVVDGAEARSTSKAQQAHKRSRGNYRKGRTPARPRSTLDQGNELRLILQAIDERRGVGLPRLRIEAEDLPRLAAANIEYAVRPNRHAGGLS